MKKRAFRVKDRKLLKNVQKQLNDKTAYKKRLENEMENKFIYPKRKLYR